MSKHILIIDSNPDIRELMDIGLSLPGYTVGHASSEYEVLVQLAGEPAPDAVVIGDLDPIPLTSLALVSDIRQERSFDHVPILMVSTQVTPDDIARAKSAGVDRYLTKPFHISALIAHLQELLDERPAA